LLGEKKFIASAPPASELGRWTEWYVPKIRKAIVGGIGLITIFLVIFATYC